MLLIYDAKVILAISVDLISKNSSEESEIVDKKMKNKNIRTSYTAQRNDARPAKRQAACRACVQKEGRAMQTSKSE